jgi:hypothetical protein
LMGREDLRERVEFNARMWSADGYVSDENDLPDE